jgi:hypothetical protein
MALRSIQLLLAAEIVWIEFVKIKVFLVCTEIQSGSWQNCVVQEL